MKSVLIRAKQYLPAASGAEQGALRYLLEHSEEVPQLSVKELSRRSFSSAATIVRLCRKLGFEGYRDLQKQLLFEIAVRTQEESRGNARVTAGSTSDIVYKITYRNIASLEETVKLVEPRVLEQAVDMICQADSVLLFGLGASQLVAKDAYLKFLRINKPCSCCEDIHSQYVIAQNSKPNDVAIVISYSGRTEEIVRCAEYLKSQGTPIIAITRFELSPISRMAACCRHVLPDRSAEYDRHSLHGLHQPEYQPECADVLPQPAGHGQSLTETKKRRCSFRGAPPFWGNTRAVLPCSLYSDTGEICFVWLTAAVILRWSSGLPSRPRSRRTWR